MHWFGVGVNVRRRADGLCPISEAMRPRRSRSTSGGCNGFAPVHVHRFWKPGIGSSVDDLGILTNRAVFVQHNVVGYLERRRYISVAGKGERRIKRGIQFFGERTRTRMVMHRRETAPPSQLMKEGDRSQARPVPDQTTSISQPHRPRSVVWGSFELLHRTTRMMLTTAGATRRNEAK